VFIVSVNLKYLSLPAVFTSNVRLAAGRCTLKMYCYRSLVFNCCFYYTVWWDL